MAKTSGITRRHFLAGTAGVGAALAVSWWSREALSFSQSRALRKFIQPLRGIGRGGMTVALPDDFPAPVTGVTHYSLTVRQFKDRLHPDLGPTTLWGYNPDEPLAEERQRHLSGVILMHRGTPIQITFTNKLPPNHLLPVDTSSSFPGAAHHQNAVAPHLHGGLVPWISGGAPTSWYTPDGRYGPSVHSVSGNTYKVLNPDLEPGQAEHYYPNNQSARLLWHHDQAHGLGRLNSYAGMASIAIVRDRFEANLRNRGLPNFVERGGLEIPIVIQDKIFVGRDVGATDPSWPGPREVGSLWYPHLYQTDIWAMGPHARGAPPDPTAVPEMFGDTMLANGTVYPQATIEARRYRLRMLNACNSRFLNLQLYVDDGSPDGITLSAAMRPTNRAGPEFLVLGTDGGFLPRPVRVPSGRAFDPATLGGSLITAPGERWDLLVDFSGLAGKKVILYNDAPAPFPTGGALNDYFPGSPNPTPTIPGFGPDTRQIMRFNVVPASSQDDPLRITEQTDLTRGLDPFLVPPGTAVQGGVLHLPQGIPVRQLTLNETFDRYGRLLRRLGTNQRVRGDFGRQFLSPTTETAGNHETEVWQIANLTGDTHPIHWHPVNVQLLGRQPFDLTTYTGPARGPDPTELGWKDTVRMNPGEVTTVIMRFDLPAVPFTVPPSPRTGGNEYVWQCPILERAEHEMMRPLVITGGRTGSGRPNWPSSGHPPAPKRAADRSVT